MTNYEHPAVFPNRYNYFKTEFKIYFFKSSMCFCVFVSEYACVYMCGCIYIYIYIEREREREKEREEEREIEREREREGEKEKKQFSRSVVIYEAFCSD